MTGDERSSLRRSDTSATLTQVSEHRVPYAPDFTPKTLGKRIGEDRVLWWLLDAAQRSSTKAELSLLIQKHCLEHIAKPKDRRDMASHVVQGLRNYLLCCVTDNDALELTAIGSELLSISDELRDAAFARHILASCNGLALVEAAERISYSGERPTLERLATLLDGHPTSKNVSTARQWLARAGVFRGSTYEVDAAGLARVLGSTTQRMFGLDPAQLEFLLCVRLLEKQTGEQWIRASEAKKVAIAKTPGLSIPHKSLSQYVRQLQKLGVVECRLAEGRGGTGTTVRLLAKAHEFTDEQLRSLIEQVGTGIPLDDLNPLKSVLEQLSDGDSHARGEAGEMLAVHLCVSLGLRVEAWRSRAPEAEIDLIADRTVGLAYQRWAIQVKNTESNVDSDRVDREIGAAAGLEVTHILFVVPRATLTGAARREALIRSMLTSMHVYYVDQEFFTDGIEVSAVLSELQAQSSRLALAKRLEAKRRLSPGV